MEDLLGVLALGVYIVAIVSLAAGVTYSVIRIFPTQREPKKGDEADESTPAKEEQKQSGEAGAGTLFRRSKRNR